MRVLQICAAYKPAYIYGGPTMSVSMLSEQMARAGVFTEVYTTTANGNNELPVQPNIALQVEGVTVTYFTRITKDHSHFSPLLLKAVWRNAKKFDIIHIHAWWNLVSVFSCLIALIRGVPVILSPRGTLSPYSFQNKSIGPKWILHNLIGKYLLSKCHIHTTSHHEKQAIAGLTIAKSITVLPNFVKLPPQRPFIRNKYEGHFKLLFFSRIEEKKGLEILLEALKTINYPYHLTIAGNGNENYINSLKRIAKSNNSAKNITWAGFYNDDKFDMISSHDLFVLPSYDENFGNTVIESLSVGTAVLLSEHVGLADYVIKNDLGWICQTNAQSISNAINNIIKNSAGKLKTINETAPGIIYNDFYQDELVKKYIHLYEQISVA